MAKRIEGLREEWVSAYQEDGTLNLQVKDLTKVEFKYLKALEAVGIDKSHAVMWRFKCVCGEEFITIGSVASRNENRSCGCKNSKGVKHGMCDTVEYSALRSMRDRCYNPNTDSYHNYGAIGITICDRWLDKDKGFLNFFEDMGKKPTLQHSIDRINNKGNYTPENCKWATPTEQANNRRTNNTLTFNGKTQSMADWSRELGINHNTIHKRFTSGKSIEEILHKGKLPPKMYTYQGVTLDINGLAEKFDVKSKTLRARLAKGWDIEDAINGKN